MKRQVPIKIPRINANDDQVVMTNLMVKDKQFIKKGDLLAEFETTKSAVEQIAENDGYLVGINAKVGSSYMVGKTWAYLCDDPDEVIIIENQASGDSKGLLDSHLCETRITKPAMQLLEEYKLSLDDFDQDQLITTKVVREKIDFNPNLQKKNAWVRKPEKWIGDVLIFGAGGHGRSLAELIELIPGYHVAGFIDDSVPVGTKILKYKVIGKKADLKEFFSQGLILAVNGIGGIKNIIQRVEVYELLRDLNYFCPTLIHPFAFIEKTALLENGVQVFPHSYIGSQAKIEYGCIINTGAIVSHDCVLGEMVNLSPGATLAGEVIVGDKTLIGMRATINLGVKIGCGVRIGNGATVKENVPDGNIVPAGAVWPLRSY